MVSYIRLLSHIFFFLSSATQVSLHLSVPLCTRKLRINITHSGCAESFQVKIRLHHYIPGYCRIWLMVFTRRKLKCIERNSKLKPRNHIHVGFPCFVLQSKN
ncbi:hypothetical protein V8G54_016014 [Vigna mungo]|uniref:Uncharacterized protein n=1 Tax=Vigna mungo TaxID=3915 RepID=A0AAQ3RXE4_VIGMU